MKEQIKSLTIHYSGTLILEGGVRMNFHMEFDSEEDVPDWINEVLNGELSTQGYVWITEEETNKDFLVSVKKILAYHLD